MPSNSVSRMHSAEGISLIEWPDRLGGLLPANRLDVILTHTGDLESRRVLIEGGADWRRRLREAGVA